MYSHKFATRALQVLRADFITAKERVYEQVRTQMAECQAHVVVNGKAYKYGCIHNSDKETVEHVKTLFDANLDSFNEHMGTAVTSWSEVTRNMLLDAVQHSMLASSALLERTRTEPGNQQAFLDETLSTLLHELDIEKQIHTCCRECHRCEGDTIETHFACLAMHNSRVSVQEWYIILLGFLVHSVAQGDFLPYYSRNVHIPDEEAIREVLDWLDSQRWDEPTLADTLQRLASVWGLPHTFMNIQDVIHMIPPTSCYTLAKFKNIVDAMIGTPSFQATSK